MMTSKELKEMKEDLQNQFENKKTIVISINVDILIELIENQEKLEKAIKILKLCNVDIERLLIHKNVEQYNKGLYYEFCLDEKEFKLLKEVFGNES